MTITWQAEVRSPENTKNLGLIANWWQSLDTKNIAWKQRLIAKDGQADWNPQKFDESFFCVKPTLRGFTLYWIKLGDDTEKNITLAKMELDPTRQQLLVYPETQPTVVISIEGPGAYQRLLHLTNPTWSGEAGRDAAGTITGFHLVMQDAANLAEIQVDLDGNSLNSLKTLLNQ
jgi:hypothetical protein